MDDWLFVGSLFLSLLRLFKVAVDKGVWVNECYVREGGFVSCVVNFRRALCHLEVVEYEAILTLLANVFICRVFKDCHIWKATPSGSFFSKSFLKELEDIPRVRPPSSLVWLGLEPPIVKAFCWLVAFDNVSTMGNLRRRGFVLEESAEVCVLCGKEEDIDHLFALSICSFPVVSLLEEVWKRANVVEANSLNFLCNIRVGVAEEEC